MKQLTGPRSIGGAAATVLLLVLTACGGDSAGGSGDVSGSSNDDDPGASVLDESGPDSDDSDADDIDADVTGADAIDADESDADESDADVTADDDSDADDDAADSEPAQFGEGAGTVVIAGVAYDFDTDACFADGSFLQVSGPGVTAEGVPFYASISVNEDDDVDDDGSPDPTGNVTLELGTDSAFSGADDAMASYESTILVVGDQVDFQEFEYQIDASGNISGSGTITDYNGVETGFNEYVDFEFSGGC